MTAEEFFKPEVQFSRPAARSNHVRARKMGAEAGAKPFRPVAFGAAALVAVSTALAMMPSSSSALSIDDASLRSAYHVNAEPANPRCYATVKDIVNLQQRRKLSPHGPPPPSDAAVQQAQNWTESMIAQLDARQLNWIAPHVSSGYDGDISFEWWVDDPPSDKPSKSPPNRKLTMYFDGQDVTFIKVWGPDIDTEMKDGVVKRPEHWVSLWQWLTHQAV